MTIYTMLKAAIILGVCWCMDIYGIKWTDGGFWYVIASFGGYAAVIVLQENYPAPPMTFGDDE